jgi:hypothetical protein
MRAVSLKRQRANRDRRQAELDMYAQHPYCARCGRTNVPLSGHELVNRGRGGDATRPDVLLCDQCNVWCEDHPAEAEASGWKLPSASLRHQFTPDETGFYCGVCALPSLNWRHRADAA